MEDLEPPAEVAIVGTGGFLQVSDIEDLVGIPIVFRSHGITDHDLSRMQGGQSLDNCLQQPVVGHIGQPVRISRFQAVDFDGHLPAANIHRKALKGLIHSLAARVIGTFRDKNSAHVASPLWFSGRVMNRPYPGRPTGFPFSATVFPRRIVLTTFPFTAIPS